MNEEFTFTIEAVDGAPMPEKTTAKNDKDGNVSFGNATYTAAGEYKYTVKEVKGDDSNITYDTEEKTITVKVESKKSSSVSSDLNSEKGKSDTEQQIKELSVGNSEGNVQVSYVEGHRLGGAGSYTTFKTVTGPEGSYHPLCGVYYAASVDSSDSNWNIRNRYDFEADNGAGGLWMDSVLAFYQYSANASDFIKSRISTANDDHSPDRSKYLNGIKAIFLNGYPHNAANIKGTMSNEDFYRVTQAALFAFSRYGGTYKTAAELPGGVTTSDFEGKSVNEEVFTKLYNGAADNVWSYGLVDPVIDNGDGTYGSKIKIYVHWLNESATGYPQPLLSSYLVQDGEETLKADVSTVEFKNNYTAGPAEDGSIKTTVTAGGKTASSSAEATLTAAEAKSVTSVTDKIDYEGLTAGATYKVSGTLNEVEGGSVVKQIATASAECVADNSSGSWNITFENVTLEAGKTYVVFEEAVNAADENEKYEHKDASDKSQTVVVEKDDEPSSEETTTPSDEEKTPPVKEGSIKTTVTAGGKTANASAEATLTAEEAKSVTSVTDKIDYEGLKKGATYKVSGTLNEVEGGSVVKAVATAMAECVAEETSGSWEITFTNVTLEAGKTYVVYEEAVNDADESETYEHKDANDKSQTIVVEKENSTPEDDDTPNNGGSKTDDSEKGGKDSSVKDDGSNKSGGSTTTIKKSNSATTKTTSRNSSSPKTGDESSTTLWIVLMLAALAAVTVIIYRRKARQ